MGNAHTYGQRTHNNVFNYGSAQTQQTVGSNNGFNQYPGPVNSSNHMYSTISSRQSDY